MPIQLQFVDFWVFNLGCAFIVFVYRSGTKRFDYFGTTDGCSCSYTSEAEKPISSQI